MSAAQADNYQLSFALCLAFILLVPFAIAGLALINTGLGRSRSAAHAMTAGLCVVSIAVVVYFLWGFRLQESHVDFFGGHFPGTYEPAHYESPRLFFRGTGPEFVFLPALLGMFSVGLASVIPLGAAADRWRIAACCASTVLFGGLIYPLIGHLPMYAMVLSFNRDFKLVDAGGASFIQVTGGLAALSVSWLIGPRRGKYLSNGMPAAIPAHNAVFVLFGCMVAWVGWLGLNSAGAIIHLALKPETAVWVSINTTVSAAAAALAGAAVTRIRFRRPDASLIANGWMAGLVASSAGCATLKPATAILTGLVAGTLVVFSAEFFESWLRVDDPCGSISVHAVCGAWGLVAAGIFAGRTGQFMAQLVGVATLVGFVFPMTYGLNWLLNRLIPYRVSPDGERQGLDLHELGADAYPEFVVHADEFMQR
jgi:ammonium transporter, Amt family